GGEGAADPEGKGAKKRRLKREAAGLGAGAQTTPSPNYFAPSRLWLLPPLFALWVNLDSWFILGPFTVALFLVGEALHDYFAAAPPGPDAPEPGTKRRLGLILAVGLAACLLNPHGVYGFALPPELAYLLVSATDWFGQTTGISLELPARL